VIRTQRVNNALVNTEISVSMDPVKEKLNLLRRLASEKKSSPMAQSMSIGSNKPTRESSINSNTEPDSINENPAVSTSQSRPNSLAYNKYINRIRSMYDKDSPVRSSSNEPAPVKTPMNRQSSPLAQTFTDQSKESPINEEPPFRASFEISENEDEFTDLSTASNNKDNGISKYLKHVKSNGLFRMPSNRAASVENLHRNNHVFGSQAQRVGQQQHPQLELNQINRLKERFSKPDTRHASLETSNINSNYSINNFLSLQNGTRQRDQYKSLRNLNRVDDPNQYDNSFASKELPNGPKFEPSLPSESFPIAPEPVLTSGPIGSSKSKPLHRYQRSRTSDLSDLIFGEQESERFEPPVTIINEKKESQAEIDTNYNKLVDKYATDLKYTPETAIIKSSMNQTRKYADTIDAYAQQNLLFNNCNYELFILHEAIFKPQSLS
jgi:hypothetical protein